MTLFKKILCFVVLGQITVFVNNAMGANACTMVSQTQSESWASTQEIGTSNMGSQCANPTTLYYEFSTGASAPYDKAGVIVHTCTKCIEGDYELKKAGQTDACASIDGDPVPDGNIYAYECKYAPVEVTCSTGTTSCSGYNWQNSDRNPSACNSEATLCFTLTDPKNDDIISLQMFTCDACKTGFTRTRKEFTYTYNYVTPAMSCGPYEYYDCVCNKTGTDWTSIGNGREQRTVVNMNTCTESTEYRCAAGYYGNGTTCTKCGQIEGINSTSDAGSTSCTACCVDAGDTGSDDTGSFIMKTDCCFTSC